MIELILLLHILLCQQEPENDPRYCSYLWVARGPLVLENCPETPATLTLYQLVFASRDVLTGYGVIYKVGLKHSICNSLCCSCSKGKVRENLSV